MRASRWLTPLLCLALAACSSQDSPPPPSMPRLLEVPRPEVSALAESTQERLRAGRSALDAALQSPGATRQELSLVFGQTAMLYHAHSLHDAAQAAYRNARELSPENFRWAYLIGRVYRSQAAFEPALENLEQTTRLQPRFVPAWVQLGQLRFERDRLDQARSDFERALQLDPACAPALVGLGKIALAEKQFDRAVEWFRMALRLQPEASTINYPLGLAYRGLGEEAQARDYMSRRGSLSTALTDPLMAAVAALSAPWRAHQTRGVTLFEEGLYEQALEELQIAVEAAPEDAALRVNLGSTLTRLGDLEGARQAFEEAERLDPNHAMTQFYLGTLLARLGDDEAAMRHYGNALKFNPQLLDAHLNLANLLRRERQPGEAVAHYRQVVNGDPSNERARLGEVLALVAVGRHVEAIERLDQGLGAIPESRAMRQALARLLAASPDDRLRDGDRALEIARALFEEQKTLDTVVTLAMAAAEIGEFDQALEWQEQALNTARRANLEAALPGLLANLERYRADQPCRAPWAPDDPALVPPGS